MHRSAITGKKNENATKGLIVHAARLPDFEDTALEEVGWERRTRPPSLLRISP
jgi:hypothetical protein